MLTMPKENKEKQRQMIADAIANWPSRAYDGHKLGLRGMVIITKGERMEHRFCIDETAIAFDSYDADGNLVTKSYKKLSEI